jgi:flagellar biosynthetic protein FliQ
VNDADAIEIAHQTIVVTLKLGGPIMLLALVVGLAIAFLQALTQIQEMTLTFVPKLVVILVSILVLLPFMLSTLSQFTESLMSRIAAG